MRADLISSSPELRDVAREVERLTEGKIYFLYSTKPNTVIYYLFAAEEWEGAAPTRPEFHEKMTEREALTWLTAVKKELTPG